MPARKLAFAVAVLVALLTSCSNAPTPVDGGSGGGAGATGGGGGAAATGGGSGATGGGAGGGQATGGGGTGATGGGGGSQDGGCFEEPVFGPTTPPWGTGACPDAGCPGGQVCVLGVGEGGNTYGCSSMPAGCAGTPSCDCMGCICGLGCVSADADAGVLTCNNGTISGRSYKDDIHYIDGPERAALAQQALAIPLARYRYKAEPAQSPLRLGFIIEDQPDPSPAVRPDRTHVDEYGYVSLLLATVQEQHAQISQLKARIEQLERKKAK